ncbi:MAG: lytic murein transglycosylase [Alphaproteobacteria bacterium]|nr:lytic murein transglycosylase [Alphaproteobacteria bacterium]
MHKSLARWGAAATALWLLTAAAPLEPQDQKFQDFVRDFRDQARRQGIADATYDAAMAAIARNPRVEDLNLNQPEFARPIWSYLDTAVSDKRVADGRMALATNLPVLTAIEARYGVPKEVLVSVWGNESDYGRGHEPFNMFEALATLAYDGPRTDYARPELIAALKMMQQQHYGAAQMTSSWAGAFGQTQFVPSTFLAHAVDGDGDGQIDLWHSTPDALASTANVLASAGWQRGNAWGYEVALPQGFAYESADLDVTKPVGEWRRLGVKTVAGGDLPSAEEYGAIYLPSGARGPAFLVFGNFKVVLKYNNAASYALAVCLLADRLKGLPGVVGSWPREEVALTRDERVAFQNYLLKLGYDIGSVDGVLGRKARSALRDYQKKHGLAADGFPTEGLLTRLAMETMAK